MRAAIYKRYGPPEVLELVDVPRPMPKDDELLVRVVASTVSAPDWRVRKAEPAVIRFFMGLFSPKHRILGYEFAGDVVAVGKKVTQFKPGDAVFKVEFESGASPTRSTSSGYGRWCRLISF